MRTRVAVAVLVATLVPVGAALAGTSSRTSDPPVVFAAASLTEVLPRVYPDARYSFAASNQLAQQIRQGAAADVFLSANVKYADELYAAGLVRKPIPFATNSLVIVVPKSNPAAISTIGDLARRPKLRLVVAAPQVPIGLYTRKVLQRLGLLRILKKAVSLEPDVKGVVAKVALGEADAGFVYATDVKPVASKVRVIAVPARAQPRVLYEVAIVARTSRLDAAQAFIIALLGPDGRRELRSAGFGLP